MRVLVLHSRYLSGISGENQVVADEARILRGAGHDVITWQPAVDPSTTGTRMAAQAIWSTSTSERVRRLVDEHGPDVIHVHSLFPRLSPTVLRAAPSRIPVVMTLHNFRFMCLPATYLRDGRICEDCAGRVPWRGVWHRCYRESRAASAALATSLSLHRAIKTFSRVDLFLAVSRFVRDKHLQAGGADAPILVKPNFAPATERRSSPGDAVFFIGRITPEKGLDTVVDALPEGLELVVVGDGSARAHLEARGEKRIRFVGAVDASTVSELLRSARALVVPSRWYEGQPRVILEAFAAGVPVIASRIGGLPELVEGGVNGYLVDPGDEAGWREALTRVLDDDESSFLGRGAYETWRRRFTPEIAVTALEQAYAQALALRRSGTSGP